MKLYKSLLLGSLGLMAATAAVSCSEEATLDGANVVFIEMSPTDISMTVGDTIPVSAVVSNEGGKTINTPIKWSIDDPSVAELVILKKGYVKNRQVATVVERLSRAAEDETPGDETADEDTIVAPEPAPAPVDTTWTSTYALIGQRGAQGKNTILRATLENGQYAISPVSVLAREINGAVKAATSFIRSYQRNSNDTAWFSVTPFQLVDEAELSYELRVTEVVAGPENPSDAEFTFEYPDPKDNIVIDRENKRVGVVYTGPRIAGRGECELTISDGATSESAVVPIHIYPFVSPGFETFPERKRPNYDPPNPSNIKLTLMNADMDINSSYDFGVCNGIDMGRDFDIDYVYEMEKAGYFRWEVEGSAVVVEDVYPDWNYFSGYVSYIKVRSGAREGLAVLKYYLPDTVCTINLTVQDYNKTYPVDKLIIKQGENEIDYNAGVNFELGIPASLLISIEPEPSYTYHIPEITVADPSILEAEEYAKGSGYTRNFILHKAGETTITVTSLDKTVTFPVKVTDRVDYINWAATNNHEYLVGSTGELEATVYMASGNPPSGEVKWIVADPNIASVTTKPGTFSTGLLTCLNEGTTTITLDVDGAKSSPFEITVTAANDIYASNYSRRVITDSGIGYMYLILGDAEAEIYIPWIDESVHSGTFEGEDAIIFINEQEFDDVQYSVVVTDNGDGTFTITGTIYLPTGTNIVMKGDIFDGEF